MCIFAGVFFVLNRPTKDKIYFNTVTRSLPHGLIKLHLATPTSYSVRHSGFPVCCTSVRPSRTEYWSLSRLSFEQLGGGRGANQAHGSNNVLSIA